MVEVTDVKDLLSVEDTDKAGNLGACASTDVKNKVVIRIKIVVGTNLGIIDRRIAEEMENAAVSLSDMTVVGSNEPRSSGEESSAWKRAGFPVDLRRIRKISKEWLEGDRWRGRLDETPP